MENITSSPTPEQMKAAFLNGAAGRPPPGVDSKFLHPLTLEPAIVPALSIGLTITSFAIFIRMYSKIVLVKSIAYEDYVIFLAWLVILGFTVPSVLIYKVGGGSHMWDMRFQDLLKLLHYGNICGILYGIIICLIKESILLQYLRVFVPDRKANIYLYVTIQFMMWSIFLFYFIDTMFETILCIPREKIWNPFEDAGHCFDANAAYKAAGIFNVISDLAILLVPIQPILYLQMPLRRKLMVMGVFATGLCACVTSAFRTYYTFKIMQSPDVTYMVMGLWTWGEITCGVLKLFIDMGVEIQVEFARSKGQQDGITPLQKPFTKCIITNGSAEVLNGFSGYEARPTGQIDQLSGLSEWHATKRQDLEFGP